MFFRMNTSEHEPRPTFDPAIMLVCRNEPLCLARSKESPRLDFPSNIAFPFDSKANQRGKQGPC